VPCLIQSKHSWELKLELELEPFICADEVKAVKASRAGRDLGLKSTKAVACIYNSHKRLGLAYCSQW
jgi:hypothetical protein